VTGRPKGDTNTVTTPVETCVALSSDRGSTPLASTNTIRKETVLGLFFAFSVCVVVRKPRYYWIFCLSDFEYEKFLMVYMLAPQQIMEVEYHSTVSEGFL